MVLIRGHSCLIRQVWEALQSFEVANSALAEVDGSIHDNLKGVFIRALAEARARNPGSDLAQYIEAYIMIQVCHIDNFFSGLG